MKPLSVPSPMQVVVLMGGLGTRLQKETGGTPKCSANVHGRPFFQYPLELLRSYEFRKYVFCVGYGAQAVREYFGDGSRFGVSIEYSMDGPDPMGTGGALRNAIRLLDDDFLLMYGDSYMDMNYLELVSDFRVRQKRDGILGEMTLYHNRNRYGRSNVAYDGKEIRAYDKTRSSSEMEHIDYGVTALRRDALKFIPTGKQDLSILIQRLLEEKKLAAFVNQNVYREIGSPEALEEFRNFIGKRLEIRPAIFFDRDGTLNRPHRNKHGEEDSPFQPEEVTLYPDALETTPKLYRLGYRLFVVSNQPAAAKNKSSLAALFRVQEKARDLLSEAGASFDELRFCPHHPTGSAEADDSFLVGSCRCRKPMPGMLEYLSQAFGVDLKNSWMIGDSEKDIEAAGAMGVRSVYLERGGKPLQNRSPDLSVDNLSVFYEHLMRKPGGPSAFKRS